MAKKASNAAKKTLVKEGTKGVWMLGSPLHVEERDMHILFLDFEGFN